MTDTRAVISTMALSAQLVSGLFRPSYTHSSWKLLPQLFTRKQLFSTEDDSGSSDDSYNDLHSDIEKKRNISGLPKDMRCRMSHVDELPSYFDQKIHRDIKVERDEMRKAYATFGRKSGISPGIMWDTKEEYSEHFAQDLMRPSLEEAVRTTIRSNRLEAAKRDNVIANVRVRVEELMPELMQAHKEHKRKGVLKQEKKKQEGKWHELLEQAREYLGYDVQKTDPEFRALVDKMKDQAKLDRKAAKKAQRRARLEVLKTGAKVEKIVTEEQQDKEKEKGLA